MSVKRVLKHSKQFLSTKLHDWRQAGKIVLAAAVVLRVLAALVAPPISDSDSTVVALMAKHMAEGSDWPVFFYGQNYMGSLEPGVSAVLVRILGANGFAVRMGPALVSILALWALWRWGRAVGGERSGFWALLLGALGGATWFDFQIAPRGGYMVALCLITLTMWLGTCWAARWWEGRPVRARELFWFGVLGGLGIWNNWITAPALVTAALMMLVGMKGRFWRCWKGLIAALGGALLGGLPFWLHLARYGGGDIFGVANIGRKATLRQSLFHAWDRFVAYQTEGIWSVLAMAMAVAVIALAVAGAWRVAAGWREKSAEKRFGGAGLLLYCVMFAGFYFFMGFPQVNTSRYLIPLAAGLSVLGGLAAGGGTFRTAWQRRRQTFWTSVATLLVAAEACWVGHSLVKQAIEHEEQTKTWTDRLEMARQFDLDALLAPLQHYPLNFHSAEQLAVCDGVHSIYAPIQLRTEIADHAGYLSGWRGVDLFFERFKIPGIMDNTGILVVTGPHRAPGVELPPEAIAAVESDDLVARALPPAADVSMKETLWDRLENTMLVPKDNWNDIAGLSFVIRLRQPTRLSAIRFDFNAIVPGYLHGRVGQFSVELLHDGEWALCGSDAEPFLPMDWSVRRIYPCAGNSPLFYLCDDVETEAVRITLRPRRPIGARWPDWRWGVAEILLFAPEDEDESHLDAATDPMEGADLALIDLGTDEEWWAETAWLAAPRWVASRLWASQGIDEKQLVGLDPNTFPQALPSGVPEHFCDEYIGRLLDGAPIGVLVENAYERTTRQVLARLGGTIEERQLGPFLLFRVSDYDLPPGRMLDWTGHYPMLVETIP